MRGHHHALLGFEIERRAGGKINARLRLVVAAQFRRRGSRPRGNCCGGRDRPSAKCCRSTPAPARIFGLSRASAAGTSGQASSRCQASVRSSQHLVGQILQSEARQQCVRDCAGAARRAWQKACRPERTSSIPGWYSPRQASAKAVQSSLYPRGPRIFSASRATDVRQSTRVPNTSKNSARTDAGEAFTAATFVHPKRAGLRAPQPVAKSLIKWRERRDSNPRPLP